MNPRPNNAYSVSQLSQILKACFENPAFQDISVYGEVYSIRLSKFSYIELGDQGHKETNSPLLKCAFSSFSGQDFHLEEIKTGDVILVRGSLSYYPHGSSVTLWGREPIEIIQSQMGKNLLAKKKTLEKLDRLGYLDEKRKRPIPRFCKKVAILTAETGAAYQDILKTLHDRFPVSTDLYPIIVQGDQAASSIVKAMERAVKEPYDVILLGRGGGSKTDLSCFDDEKVALAIATSPIPVITCIGHTIDTAIADRVSDAHAITPTEGASLINPSLDEIRQAQTDRKQRLQKAMLQAIDAHALYLEGINQRLDALSPKLRLASERKSLEQRKHSLRDLFLSRIKLSKNSLNTLSSSLLSSYRTRLSVEKDKIRNQIQLLEVYDPEKLKEKGYALLYRNNELIRTSHQLKNGDIITITYPDGRKEAKIIPEEKVL